MKIMDGWTRLFVAVIALTLVSTVASASCASPQNAIEAENCLPGTSPSAWSTTANGDSTIQGFATEMSVNPGQTVFFKVKTPATAYRLDIYRMGYYQGNGARKVATVLPSVSLPQNQPACLTNAPTGLVDCGNWAVSASWTVPANAVSGIYFVDLLRTDTGGDSYMFFIVRDDASHSDIVFKTGDESWHAYNPYGGHSLYGDTGFNLLNRAYKVSYNRPFNALESESWVFYAEYPMVRWLEANGYDVSYISSVDAARNGNLIKNHKLFLSVGHDEYWSGPARTNVEAARDAGVHLGFFSGNEVFWKTRWENSIDGSNTPYRTLVCYKETLGPNSQPPGTAAVDPLDPPTWTGTWRDPIKSPPADGGKPENALTGQLFRVNGPAGDNTNLSIKIPAADGKMRFWRNTAVASQSAGQTWTLAGGSLGYEWDTEEDNGFRPAGLFDLSTATYALTSSYLQDYGGTYGAGTATHHMSLYRAASGALVFGSGTVQWPWGLDDTHDGSAPIGIDVNMRQATVNLFADMGVQPVSLQAGLLPASASSDVTRPTSTITSPAAGASIPVGSSVTIQGTASDVGGVVGGVEVSTDGGTTWRAATGRGSWTYLWAASGAAGPVTIRSRAVDDSGNLETPSPGTTVNLTRVCPCSIWGSGTVPTTVDAGADSSLELGVKFKSDVNGTINGIRFYKSSANTGTHVGNLWTSTGTLLATANFTSESATGWQQVNFSSPVQIVVGTVYVASYHVNNGHYSADLNYFTTKGTDAPPLHALQDGISGADGVFAYSSTTTFPTSTWQSTNYWVDVSFMPSVALNSITVAPTNPTVTGGGTQQFAATGHYADGSTADITTQVAWSSSNTAVATINASGLATAIAGGSTTIQASQGSVSGSTGLTVQPSALSVTTTSLSGGYLNQPYSASLAASGGTAPYAWSLANTTSLPPGLTLSSSGQIAGTPTAVGTTTFTVQVSDGGTPQQTATRQLSITIDAAPSFWTIWPSTAVPTLADAGGDGPVELGVRFKADVDGVVNAIRFYKSSANVGPHVVNLWTNTGTLLATATAGNETASGWQQVNFATPVPITANTVYVASYHVNFGHYSADYDYFATAGSDNPPIHALLDGIGGPNGAFAYGSNSAFPNSGYLSSNYWVDVVFALPVTVQSIAVTPANPTIAVGATQQFTATGTYTDGSTKDITSQVTWSSSNTGVATINSSGLATAVGGGSTTIKATQGSVSGNTILTAQVVPLGITTTSLPGATVGLSYSVKMSAAGGVPPYTWSLANNTVLPPGLAIASSSGQITGTPTQDGSFTFMVQVSDSGSPQHTATQQFNLAVAPTPPFWTIWPATAAPTLADIGPDAGVELGVRFQSDTNGVVKGVRFYKSTANTGPHVGNLWSATGTLLAAATFANETASGWQEVSFSPPVAISANTVYVASYHTNTGHYAADQNYFANAVDSPPLHALKDDTSGANGVFAYGTTSVFPNSSHLSSNYWVDVVFALSSQLNSIAVTPVNPTTAAGGSQQFTATGTYSDGSTANITTQVTWSSSNTSVATINASGLATAVAAGTSTITATQGSITGSTTLTVQPQPPAITTTSLPNGTVGQTYSATLAASGGTGAYNWALSGGTTLPGGLSLSSSGQITGTPTTAGTTNFSVQVTDSGSPAQSATKSLSITVTAAISGTISGTGGNGATVTLSGVANATVTASASGTYTFTGLGSGNYTVTPSKAGFIFTPANRAVTVATANVTGVNFTSAAQLTIDRTATTNRSGTGANITSPAFSTTAANELLLAFVSADANSGTTTVTSVTGAGLTWSLVQRTNAQLGTAEIWRAFAPATLSNVTVRANLSQSVSASITVVTFRGVDTSGTGGSGAIGATGSGSASTGAPTASLTTTRDNSWVIGVGNDPTNRVARTMGANQTMVNQFQSTSPATYWVQRRSATTPLTGTVVTINDTAPTSDRYNLSICEVRAAQ